MFAALLSIVLAAPTPWAVNSANTLVWDSKPYLPIGLRIPGTLEAIERADKLGAKDVIVELPASGSGWSQCFKALEDREMRYILCINSLGPMASGIRVEPENLRVPNINSTRRIDLPLPGVDYGWMVLADQRDGSILESKRISASGGTIGTNILNEGGGNLVAIFYPYQKNLPYLDLWDGFDQHRDSMIRSLRLSPPGPGLRGILNPLGTVVQFPSAEPQYVPTSRIFRLSFESYLRKKYTTVSAALRAWSISAPDFDTFSVLSRLVPLWTRTRGISYLWDPETDKTYLCESRKTVAWRDIQELFAQANANRVARWCDSLKRILHVPVVQEWKGYSGPYIGTQPPVDGIGVSMEASSIDGMLDQPARAAALLDGWKHGGWFVVSSVKPDAQMSDALLTASVEDAVSLGARGLYVRSDNPADFDRVKTAAQTRLTALSGSRGRYLPYPLSARNPAMVQRVLGGVWWVPGSGEGERIELGAKYGSYRYAGEGQSFYALWSRIGDTKIKIRVANPKEIQVTTVDGFPVQFKVNKAVIELALTGSPILFRGLDQAPIPVDAFEEMLAQTTEILRLFGNGVPNADQELLMAKDFLEIFPNAPGKTMAQAAKQLYRVAAGTLDYCWLEAESSPEYTFSEALEDQGCSGGGYLNLKTEVSSDLAPHYARYSVRPHRTGNHNVWIAARMGPLDTDSLLVQVGDRVLRVVDPPVSPYGNGFAWYRLGDFNVQGGSMDLTVEFRSRLPKDVAVDCIVVTPNAFRPDALTPPIVIPKAN